MPSAESRLLQLNAVEPCVWVQVAQVKGSAPRGPGTWMAVAQHTLIGTIGGGHLEWVAIRHARDMLHQAKVDPVPRMLRLPLGPSLGQCCGGEVVLRMEHWVPGEAALNANRWNLPGRPVVVFGGGHVGTALVHILAELPVQVHWIDSRDAQFPAQLPDRVHAQSMDPVHDAVDDLPTDSHVLIMSFSHAEDFDVLHRVLLRQRQTPCFPYVGLIGSRSKWASFQSRLRARGIENEELSRVFCPVGLAGIASKHPQAIAVSVAAQLLQMGLVIEPSHVPEKES